MPKVPQIKSGRFIKILERLGFILVRQRGSHAIMKHLDERMVIVPMHSGDIPSGTLRGILVDAKLTVEDLDE